MTEHPTLGERQKPGLLVTKTEPQHPILSGRLLMNASWRNERNTSLLGGGGAEGGSHQPEAGRI